MYNMLFGKNPMSSVLLTMLNLTEANCGRFRDTYIENGNIVVYTRNGGGNRDSYQDVFDSLGEHPNYVSDYDDEYDCTYAYIEFSVPEEYKELVEALEKNQEPTQTVSEKFNALIEKMNKK